MTKIMIILFHILRAIIIVKLMFYIIKLSTQSNNGYIILVILLIYLWTLRLIKVVYEELLTKLELRENKRFCA